MRNLSRGALGSLLVFFTLFAYSSICPGEVITSDFNRDGNPDAWSTYNGRRLERQELDLNYDGKIDAVYVYDPSGKVVEESLDTNYDGKMDNWRSYREGKIVLDKLDGDFDGRVDIWIYVDKGGIYRIERDVDGDGKPDDVSVY